MLNKKMKQTAVVEFDLSDQRAHFFCLLCIQCMTAAAAVAINLFSSGKFTGCRCLTLTSSI